MVGWVVERKLREHESEREATSKGIETKREQQV